MSFFRVCLIVGFVSTQNYLHANNFEYTGKCIFSGYIQDFELCLEKELAVYDKQLNPLYKEFFKNRSDLKLKKTESLWVRFKEADCDYMAIGVQEGKYYPVVHSICLINKTKARVAELQRSFFVSKWFGNHPEK